MKTLRDAVFYMYTLILYTNICDFKIWPLRSFKVNVGQKLQSKVTPSVCILVLSIEIYLVMLV